MEQVKPTTPSGDHYSEVKKIASAVEGMANRFGGTCLERALTAQFMLGRRGYASTLRIGVKPPNAGTLEAHAWLEYSGRAVIGGVGPKVTEYTTLPEVGVGVPSLSSKHHSL
jgi:hypothetical protein